MSKQSSKILSTLSPQKNQLAADIGPSSGSINELQRPRAESQQINIPNSPQVASKAPSTLKLPSIDERNYNSGSNYGESKESSYERTQNSSKEEHKQSLKERVAKRIASRYINLKSKLQNQTSHIQMPSQSDLSTLSLKRDCSCEDQQKLHHHQYNNTNFNITINLVNNQLVSDLTNEEDSYNLQQVYRQNQQKPARYRHYENSNLQNQERAMSRQALSNLRPSLQQQQQLQQQSSQAINQALEFLDEEFQVRSKSCGRGMWKRPNEIAEELNNKSDGSMKFDVNKSKKQYESMIKNFERKNALPENINVNKLISTINNKPYLKFYQQQNAVHGGDREKPDAIAANLVRPKQSKNPKAGEEGEGSNMQQNIIFSKSKPTNYNKYENEGPDKSLNLEQEALIHLGQEEKTKIVEVMNRRVKNEQKVMRRNSIKKIEALQGRMKERSAKGESENDGMKSLSFNFSDQSLLFNNRVGGNNFKINQNQEESLAVPLLPKSLAINPNQTQEINDLNEEMRIEENYDMPARQTPSIVSRKKRLKEIMSQKYLKEKYSHDSTSNQEANSQTLNQEQNRMDQIQSLEQVDQNQLLKNIKGSKSAQYLKIKPSNDKQELLKQMTAIQVNTPYQQNETQQFMIQSSSSNKSQSLSQSNQEHNQKQSNIELLQKRRNQTEERQVPADKSESKNIQNVRLKNLRTLISMYQDDKTKQEFLKKNPDLNNVMESDQHANLFKQEISGKIPTKNKLRYLPLNQKLDIINKFKLQPKQVLTKSERNVIQLEKSLFIPDQIKITNLKKLLHTNVSKVNKWIKNSLNGTYKYDFEYFMQNDKTMVDKNSVQYEQLVREQKAREEISQQIEAWKGGYLDQNMRAFDITQKKLINDILTKFQVQGSTLLPILDRSQIENELKLQDIEKLQEDILKQHEEVEQKLRALKEKKFKKWKVLADQFKKRQATLSTKTNLPKSSSKKQYANTINRNNTFDGQSGSMLSPDQLSPNISPRQDLKQDLQTYRKLTNFSTLSPDEELQSYLPFLNSLENSLSPGSRVQFQNEFFGKSIVQSSPKLFDVNEDKQEKRENRKLMRNLENEVQNQQKLIKNVSKDLEEMSYFKVKEENGDIKEQDPLLPDNFYIKSGKKKHFSKNIAIWKQQEIYDELKGDWKDQMKKFRILQHK